MSTDPLDFLTESKSQTSEDALNFLGEKVSRKKSLLGALPKGLIKGMSKFSPIPSFGPVPQKLGERVTEQVLPTREGGIEDILEFTGEAIPFAAMGPEGIIAKGTQALAGGVGKKGAKELGLPEWAQDVVGGVSMAVPGIAKGAAIKAITPGAKEKSIYEFLKSKGLPDEDITPIIQDKKKLSFFSKGAQKFEKDDPWLKGIKEKLGGVFEDVRERGTNAGHLEGKALSKFEDSFYQKLSKVPRMYQGLIKKEVEDLFNNPITFTELHDFDRAINAIVKGVEGGKAAVGIMKEPIQNAQKEMNPPLYHELRMAKDSYAKLAKYFDKMTKKDWDSLLNMGQAGGTLLAALSLNPALIKTAATAAALRKGSKMMLSNPRLYNIHTKMWNEFLKGKSARALQLAELFIKESDKDKKSNRSQ